MPEPDAAAQAADRDRADRDLLVDAAREAGRIARRHRLRGVEPVEKPDGQGPVTAADLEIDAMLRARLLAARPGYGWLSEESADDPARLGAARVFVIDPIDGTRAFADGQGDYTHALAVVERGVPVAAAIHQPERDRMWAAARGAGATRDGAPLAPTGRAGLDGATVLANRASFDARHWRLGPPPVRRTFRSSLAYRMALVAEGRFDAMVTLRASWEWDIAAGALLCLEAGAAATDRDGRALRFNNPHPQVGGALAATPAVHAALLDRLARAG